MSEQKSKKTLLIGAIAGLAGFTVAYFGVQLLFKKDLETELLDAAQQLNKNTPLLVDEATRLDSASAVGRTGFIYYYTRLDQLKSEIDQLTVDEFVRPNIIDYVKNSPEMKGFRDNNITIDYRYYDKKGDFITEISVTPELYAKNDSDKNE